MKRPSLLCALLSLAICAGALPAQERPHAFTGATLYPVAGPPVEDGVLVVQDGTIRAVGPANAVEIPGNAVRHDAAGKVVMPGLVDTHSHVGQVSGGDRSAAMHPGVRALDAVNVRSPSLWRARAGGITTVNVMPGSGLLMSGQTVYLKLRDGTTIDELLLCEDPLEDVCGGMKMANGTNPQGDPPLPGTRARAAAIVRQQFIDAQEYRREMREAESPEDRPDRDLGMEALVEVLEGERVVHFHTHRHDDVMTALRLAEEFGFELVLQHVSEGWKVADEIAAADVPASIIVLDSPGGKHEADELLWKTGRVLDEAGVQVAYHTDDYITDSRLFLRSAAFGVRAGLSRSEALEAMTLAGAEMMGLADRIGSLEAGKDADFVVLSGDPLSTYTLVEETWIEGRKVFDREDPAHRDYATGGWDVYRGDGLHAHGRRGGRR